jgi:predicted permease
MPLVYASLLSAVIVGTDVRLPHIAEDAISLGGQMAIPLMLLSLGAAMARLDVPATAQCCGLAAFRLCFGAGVGYTVAWAFGLTGATRAAFVLQAAMPVAINSYLFAERWDSEPHKVAALVTASTLGSCATTPALLLLLG